MAADQVLVLLATAAVLELSCGQAYNGYINPLFLPRGSRRGSLLYDPDTGDLKDNGYLLARRDDYQRLPLPQHYDRYDDFRRYQSPYDSDRRYQSRFESDRRYPNPYGSYRRLSNSYDGYRRYPDGFEGRLNALTLEDNRLQYPSGIGLASTASPLDREQLLDRGVGLRGRILGLDRGASLDGRSLVYEQRLGLGLDRGEGLGLDRDRGQGFGLDRSLGSNRGLDDLESQQRLDRGQILSTLSPELSVSVNPNSSTG